MSLSTGKSYKLYCVLRWLWLLLKNSSETSQSIRIPSLTEKILSLYCTYKSLISVCSALFLVLSQLWADGSKSCNQSLVTIFGSVLRLTRRGRLAVMCQYQVNPVKVFVEGYQRAECMCWSSVTALPVAIVREGGTIIFSHVFSTCSHPPQTNFSPLLGAYQSTVIKDHRHCYELTSKANASHQLNNFRERWREHRKTPALS